MVGGGAIGLVLVTFKTYPGKLIDSVQTSNLRVRWYVHHHGADQPLIDELSALQRRVEFSTYFHKCNRGLARSWNEGIRQAYEDGCRFVIVVNDDLYFTEGGLERFVAFIEKSSGCGLVFLNGVEAGGSPNAGRVLSQDFACFAIMPSAVEAVGYFDETFAPAYYEDTDYNIRCRLAGVSSALDPGVGVVHERSKTVRENPELDPTSFLAANHAHYVRKWGTPGSETHRTPFGDPRLGVKIAWEDRTAPHRVG